MTRAHPYLWLVAGLLVSASASCAGGSADGQRTETAGSTSDAPARQAVPGVGGVCNDQRFERIRTIDTTRAQRDSLPTSFEKASNGLVTTLYYTADTLRVVDRLGFGEGGRTRQTYYLLGADSYLLVERTYTYAELINEKRRTVVKDSVVDSLVVCNGVASPGSRWEKTPVDSENVWLRELLKTFPRRSNLGQ